MAARKPAKKPAAPKPAAPKVHELSPGKSRRHREANRCPAGNVVANPRTGACSSECKSAAACTVARFTED